MSDFIRGFNTTKRIQDLPAFEFRIGIHTGPVITGVVGLKKFTYDIWGDAVNMAARMEQHGEAGRINISDNTYQLIKDKIKCTHRGSIEAKNKGKAICILQKRFQLSIIKVQSNAFLEEDGRQNSNP